MKRFLLLFLMLCSLDAYSHRDTIIKLKGNRLVGLPEEYQPAEFDFEQLKLTISDKTVTFPDCARHIFQFSREKLLITSSWYHDARADSFPPYLAIGHENNYPNNLLINMQTLKPIATDWGYGSNQGERECIEHFDVESR